VRRHGLLIVVAVVVATVAACGGGSTGGVGGGGGGGGNVQAPGDAGARALLDADLAARGAQDLNARYSLESPSYRAACSPTHFAIGAGNDWYGAPPALRLASATYRDIGARDVKVTVNGNTAGIVFMVTAKGQDLFRVGDPNPYTLVYEQGQWWKDDLRPNDLLGNVC